MDVGMQSPKQLNGTTVSVMVYVEDVDAFARQAEQGGAKVLRPVADQFYGERSVSLQDPFGHTWHFSTVTETLSFAEMMKRAPK
jgi:PhnB protein